MSLDINLTCVYVGLNLEKNSFQNKKSNMDCLVLVKLIFEINLHFIVKTTCYFFVERYISNLLIKDLTKDLTKIYVI